MTARVVAVVGGAASGVLVAANLARGAARERSGAPLDVVVIDPRPDAGRGAAFGGNDDAHLLNVAAARMSAVPDDPDHFLRWMNTFVRPTAPAAYVPRRLYGLYLDELLQDAFDGARGRARLIRIHTRATAVSVAEPDDRRSDHRVAGVPGHHRVLVRLATGHWLGADDVVLALGSPGPGTGWAPAELLTCGRFVADPWGTDLRERIGPAREQGPTGAEPLPVLLVGSGLTAVDAALTLLAQGHRVRVVSRHGLLPSVHRPGLPLLGPAPAVPDPLTLESLEQLLANSVRGSKARFGDWRPGIDALRLVTIALWDALPTPDRERFVREGASWWDRHRHRMAPEVGAAIGQARADGRLRVQVGQIAWAETAGDRVRVGLMDGSTVAAGWVVNCTGPDAPIAHSADPLVCDLLTTGHSRPGPLGIGLDTAPDSRLIGRSGEPSRALWAIGLLRKGTLWECIAMPELRVHAARLAEQLLAAAPARTGGRTGGRDVAGEPDSHPWAASSSSSLA